MKQSLNSYTCESCHTLKYAGKLHQTFYRQSLLLYTVVAMLFYHVIVGDWLYS